MMKNFRNNPVKTLAGSQVTLMKDFAKLEGIDFVRNEHHFARNAYHIKRFCNISHEDGTKLSIRTSGTEPKIKFYIEVHRYSKIT
jgi:phosphoglucomutase